MSDPAVLSHPATVMDVKDLVRSATFWGRLLGVTLGAPRSSGGYLTVGELGSGTTLVMQRVDEPRHVKNRVHLDFTVEDVEAAASLIVDLGGSRLPKRFTGRWRDHGRPRRQRILHRCVHQGHLG